MANDQALTSVEVGILLRVAIALEGEVAAGTVPDRLTARIASAIPEAALDFDHRAYMDYEPASDPESNLSPDAWRAFKGLMRLVQRLHYVSSGGPGGVGELIKPIE